MADLYGPIQLKIGDAADWTSENPVLLEGEVGISNIASTRKGMKVGDGATAWNSLGYAAGTFAKPGLNITQASPQPGVVIAGGTYESGEIKLGQSSGRTGAVVVGVAKGDGVGWIGGTSSRMYGVVGGYHDVETGATGEISLRGPGLVIGGIFADGLGDVRLSADYGWAGGYATNWGSATSVDTEIYSNWNGFAFGYAVYGGRIYSEGGLALGKAYGRGAEIRSLYGWAGGVAYTGDDTSIATKSATISANENGSFAFGNIYIPNIANAIGVITTTYPGAFAAGNSYLKADGYAGIVATAKGAFALGAVTNYNASAANIQLKASGVGAMASGYASAQFEGSNTKIQAGDHGAHAFGYASTQFGASAGAVSAYIFANGLGSLAGGFALADASGQSARIEANDDGAIAWGYAKNTDILATNEGSVQFAPGTNNQAHSVAVGANIRLNALVPSTELRDGDMWFTAGYIYARQNGVSGKVQII